MKKKDIILIVISILLLIILVVLPSKEKNNEKEKTTSTVDDIIKNSEKIKEEEKRPYKKIKVREYKDLRMQEKPMIFVFTQNSCSYCHYAKPILEHISYKYNIEIYNINLTDTNDEEKEMLININGNYRNGIQTPLIEITKQNNVLATRIGLAEEEDYIDLFKENKVIGE